MGTKIYVWKDGSWEYEDKMKTGLVTIKPNYIVMEVPDYMEEAEINNWVLKKQKPLDYTGNMLVAKYTALECEKCGNLHIPEKYVEAVRCGVCGKFHDFSTDTYVAVAGNITVGMGGGIIGPNIKDDDATVKKVSVFCRGKCFQSVCKDALTSKRTPLKSVKPVRTEEI